MATNEKFNDTKCKQECRAMETEMESSVGGKINCYKYFGNYFYIRFIFTNKVKHMQITWFSVSFLSIWRNSYISYDHGL